ncbi:hypothetical protein COV25_01950 [candidate division WWE3 bacterium CG10_big_fil_rev_8_21_14_0_10_35_32]|nr:MAG: hypothetical protein COV25_01950 [candidate division WWE3 bacterium CG10_big_fil_rev_8_21_14_0_10_35_32]
MSKLADKIIHGARGMEFKKLHISMAKELYDAFSNRYPYGSHSRIISIAIAEKLKKAEEKDLLYAQEYFRRTILMKTEWDTITENE